MINIVCYTLYDITPSGIKSHTRSLNFPTTDRTGRIIHNIQGWDEARNQQRNWETILQVVSLRAQPENCTLPVSFITPLAKTEFSVKKGKSKVWSFAFDSEIDDAFEVNDNPIGALIDDVNMVPMITNLTESSNVGPVLQSIVNKNIYFTYEKT